MLFNGILVENQKWNYLTQSWGIRGYIAKDISLKVNMQLEFELDYFRATVQHFSHYNMRTPTSKNKARRRLECHKLLETLWNEKCRTHTHTYIYIYISSKKEFTNFYRMKSKQLTQGNIGMEPSENWNHFTLLMV